MGIIYNAMGDSRKIEALAETWGVPKVGEKYPLSLLLYRTDDGECGLLKSDELSDDLANPFFWYDFGEYLLGEFSDLADQKEYEGTVWAWSGYYVRYKNGKCRFSGKYRQMQICDVKG